MGLPVDAALAAFQSATRLDHGDPLFRVGNAVRDRVSAGLAPYHDSPAAALVSGFLIGDVRTLPSLDAEHLRRAGLSHFVAVSGSNVAVFEEQILTNDMSDPGDSGSLVLDEANHAVGLLFAGSSSVTVINPIDAVLSSLNITI